MKIFCLFSVLFHSVIGTNHENRRRLAPEASIIHELEQQMSQGIKHPRFSITALFNEGQELITADTELFEFDVVLTNPSVTSLTTFSVGGFTSFVENPIKLLVADHENTISNDFAILTVNEKDGSVSGIVQKGNRFMKIEQRRDEYTVAASLVFDPNEHWECMLDKHAMVNDHNHNHDHDHEESHDGNLFKLMPKDLIHGQNLRRLFDGISTKETESRKLYATDTFPNAWSYQVDLYIEVDDEFVQNHDTDLVNMPNTINYVNALISAVSAIYEREIDCHLNVLHISKTSIYDGAADAVEALNIMQETYSGSTWHYTDPTTGENPDLQHALLYRTPRAGYASVGGVCDSQIGYGVSTGVKGTLEDIDGSVFWDLIVFAHEIGHNFNSRHTHDVSGYNPVVDECGNGECNSLVTGEPVSSGEASIMSYCNKCSGGINNMGTSFGGYWLEDNRDNIGNWANNNASVPFGQDPKRVPKVLYDYVSNRGECVKPYLTPDIQTCSQDSDCHDGNSCTVDSCSGGQCTNEMLANCCGNFICEAGETGCSDCGPFKVNTPTCSSCVIPYGEMFNVEAVDNITLTSIDFKIHSGSNTITLFTAPDGYSDKQRNPDAWTQLFTGVFEVSSTFSTVSVDFDDIYLSAGSIQAFYIASTTQVASLGDNADNPLANDGRLKLLNPTRAVTETQFGPGYSNVISWVGSMYYSIKAPPAVPTASPSRNPTSSPSRQPSSTNPSNSPSASPTVKSTNSPSKSPTISSSTPSRLPSAKPIIIGTDAPSKSPTTNKPSNKPSPPPTRLQTTSPTPNPSISPTHMLPTKAPTPNSTKLPTLKPSKRPSYRPSKPPTTMPAVLSRTLTYSVDLCYPGCGNFRDIYTDNEFENLIKSYVPCTSKKCIVNIIEESNQCSSCTVSLSFFGGTTQSSSITFEVLSTTQLNEAVALSNLNSNITIMNKQLAEDRSSFRVNSEYTVSTAVPTPSIPMTRPTQDFSSGKSGKIEKAGKAIKKDHLKTFKPTQQNITTKPTQAPKSSKSGKSFGKLNEDNRNEKKKKKVKIKQKKKDKGKPLSIKKEKKQLAKQSDSGLTNFSKLTKKEKKDFLRTQKIMSSYGQGSVKLSKKEKKEIAKESGS